MIQVLAGLAAAVAVGGVCLIIAGALPTARLSLRWRGLGAGRQRLLVLGLAAGLVTALFTRWLPSLLLVPLVIAVVPSLLRDPADRDVEILEALDRWVRGLTASLLTGRSVSDAIKSTRGQAPPVLAEPVRLLAVRLDQHWPLPEALSAFADEVAHPDSDAVAAALIVAGQRGTSAAATLEALADSVQDRLGAAREMSNERAKPRIVVRQVTAITAVVLGLAIVTSPAYFAPYRSGLGPLIATGLVLIYIGALAKLQAAGRPAPRARIRLETGATL